MDIPFDFVVGIRNEILRHKVSGIQRFLHNSCYIVNVFEHQGMACGGYHIIFL